MNTEGVQQRLGDYRLLRPQGQGLSANVYIGEHVGTGMPAVIKVLPGYWDDNEIQKFLARAIILADLRHPHIINVQDYGVEQGHAYLVMDYVIGGSLRQHHPRGTRLTLKTILPYVQQVADALQYIHQRNLIHRDVKPHNMLLNEKNQVLLSDFGIAVVSHSHDEGPILQDFEGTAPYAAPEQLQGCPCCNSDQYALAVTIYEWLCGEWPFIGSFDDIVGQHVYATPPPFAKRGVEVASTVEHVIMKALAKEPEQRYATIGEFALAFEEVARQASPARPQFKSPFPPRVP